MLGQRILAWVDKRLRQATGKLNEPLGGISVMLLEDFAQLPPVGDKPIPVQFFTHTAWTFHLWTI